MKILMLKSRLVNFFELLTISPILFPKLVIDYFLIKKEIRKRQGLLATANNTDDPEAFEKYFNLKDNFIQISLIRVVRLGLITSKNKLEILDLGTGAGYFPFICNYYENNCEAIDIAGNQFYDQSTEVLNLKKYHQEIFFNEELVTSKKYDLICAYMICFNGHKTSKLWAEKEWSKFLINLITNNLNLDGRIFLSFNLESDGKPFSSELENFFKMISKKISSNEILIQNSVELESILQNYKNIK